MKKVKAVKAAKIATLAAGAIALKKLKKTPIILPIPVAVPTPFISKNFDFSKSLYGLGGGASIGLDAPSVDVGAGPIQGLITGAQRILTAG